LLVLVLRVHEFGNLFDDWMSFDFGLEGMWLTCRLVLVLLRFSEEWRSLNGGWVGREVDGGLSFERS